MSLFEPLALRGITLRNRIGVSPMCQYSCTDGVVDDWHLVHLGSRAVGGTGLVIAEASAVSPEGRISPADAGIWDERHTAAWAPVAAFVRKAGAVPAIQLAHAGRKASTAAPWLGGKPVGVEAGGWSPVLGPSAIAFNELSQRPQELDLAGIQRLIGDFRAAAVRALEAGFQVVELHAAHGYLLHAFLSPISNQRRDAYGGSFENRTRFLREATAAVRAVWPERLPLLVRISATDWADDQAGWDITQSVELSRQLKNLGVDLIDVSSAGTLAKGAIPIGPGFQVPFAARIRREAGIPTAAVGLITEAAQAEAIVAQGEADLVLLARELLRDPYWPRRAAQELGARLEPPPQYQRAW